MPRHLVVLGGGVAGLSAAFSAARAAGACARVTLVESSPRVGGWLHSERHGGFLFERGCRGIRPSSPTAAAVLELVEALGLAPQTLAASPASATRYVLHRGRLEALPRNLLGALSNPLTRAAPSWLLRDALLTRASPASLAHLASKAAASAPGIDWSPEARASLDVDESVAAFAERHFGPFVARVLLDAALGGIYAGDIDTLSARSVLASLVDAEASGSGSILRGFVRKRMMPQPQGPAQHTSPSSSSSSPFVSACVSASSVSFEDGVGALPTALEAALLSGRGGPGISFPPVTILRGWCVEGLSQPPSSSGDGTSPSLDPVTHVRIRRGAAVPGAAAAPTSPPPSGTSSSSDGDTMTLHADAIVCALPASALHRVLSSSPSLGPLVSRDAAAACAAIPFATVGVVSMAWQHPTGQPPPPPLSPSLPTPGISAAEHGSSPLLPPLSLSPYPALPMHGFGFLMPTCERDASASTPVLGMTWDSVVFPGQTRAWTERRRGDASAASPPTLSPGVASDLPRAIVESETRVTVMLGGATWMNPPPSSSHTSLDDLTHLALSTARKYARCGVGAPPSIILPSIAENAIPQYTLGHEGRVVRVEAALKHAFGRRCVLVGNSWRGIGVADTVSGALKAGRDIVDGWAT